MANSKHPGGRKTTITIHLSSTHDPDEIMTDDDDDNDDDDSYASCRTINPDPRDRGTASVAIASEPTDLDSLGVFDATGGVVFVRNHILVRLERFGTLPDGRILLTIADATVLPAFSPRPGDEGA